MILEHASVRAAGFEVHAWMSPHGVAAIHLGVVPPVATIGGSSPVAGVEIGAASDSARTLSLSLAAYLQGGRLAWDGSLDTRGIPEFSLLVYEATRRVPSGSVATYRDVAQALGRSRAVRAVGNALHRNPFPLLIPCHRIILGSGRLGGYACGVGAKKRLLDLEAGQAAFEFPDDAS